MLIGDNQSWPATSDRADSCCLIVGIFDFQFIEIRLYFAVVRPGIQLEPGFVRNIDLNIPSPILHLNIAQFIQTQFDSAVFVLQSHIAGNAVQPNIFRPRVQA